MEITIVQYELLQSSDIDMLVMNVNDGFAKGWELYGKPFFADGFYHQAMVLKEHQLD